MPRVRSRGRKRTAPAATATNSRRERCLELISPDCVVIERRKYIAATPKGRPAPTSTGTDTFSAGERIVRTDVLQISNKNSVATNEWHDEPSGSRRFVAWLRQWPSAARSGGAWVRPARGIETAMAVPTSGNRSTHPDR